MLIIKANIVNQRWHKEEKKVRGQSFFEVSLSECTCGTKLWEFWRKISIFSETDICDWMMWESPAWGLETSVSIGLNWNQMLDVTCVSFVCCIHVSCMNIPCMHIGPTHHGIRHLTAQFSLKVVTMLRWYCVLLYAIICLDKNHHVLGIQIK